MKWKGCSSYMISLGGGMLGFGTALFLVPSVGLADSLSPSSYSTTLSIGGSTTINKVITVNAGTPTTAKVDVVFVADTTGSMVGQIASAKSGATSILTALSGLGDVQFGVASYKDRFDGYTSRIEQGLTSSTSAVTSAINTWTAGGGGDFPEANLISWSQVANDIAWRDGSRRFIVTFGDAPGHIQPSNPAYPTEAGAIAALNAKNIQMEIINTGTDSTGMNSACGASVDCTAGQALRFAAATSGHVYNNFDATQTAAKIQSAITTAFATYSTVELQAVGNLPGVGVTTCAPISGSFDRSSTQTFNCSVTFTGLTSGVHSFVINALVDKGIIATESDRITVAGTAPVPEPSTMLLLGSGLVGLAFLRRRAA